MADEIINLQDYKNRDTVAALTDLLAAAHKGQIRGLVFAFKSGTRHRIGITGDYWTDPGQGLATVARAAHRLNELISASERDDDYEAAAR